MKIEGSRYTTEYLAWKNMKARCNNPNAANYPHYGGRGITYDPAWETFRGFFADMGEGPSGLSLERIDNDGPYAAYNCCWATASQQRRNQRPQWSNVTAHNTSGIRGVSYCDRDGRYVTYFHEDRRQVKLYYGPDFLEACCARKSWEASKARGEA